MQQTVLVGSSDDVALGRDERLEAMALSRARHLTLLSVELAARIVKGLTADLMPEIVEQLHIEDPALPPERELLRLRVWLGSEEFVCLLQLRHRVGDCRNLAKVCDNLIFTLDLLKLVLNLTHFCHSLADCLHIDVQVLCGCLIQLVVALLEMREPGFGAKFVLYECFLLGGKFCVNNLSDSILDKVKETIETFSQSVKLFFERSHLFETTR